VIDELSHAPQFRPRLTPLTPLALYAERAGARSLVMQLMAATDARLRALRAVATPDCVVLLGQERELPWADGVVYLGQDARAPLLLLPTYCEPDVPLDLFEQRIVAGAQPAPIAVLPHAKRVIAVGHARLLECAALKRWLAAAQDAAW
jgi:hypothetical protein